MNATRVVETAIFVYLEKQLQVASRLPYRELAGIKLALVDARTPNELAAVLRSRLLGFRAASEVDFLRLALRLFVATSGRRAA